MDIEIKISLCIPTMDRFEFLDFYLVKYIEYYNKGLIDEIIINDENGNDYEKLKKYKQSPIKVYKNDTIIGPFLNKLKVCSYANHPYIVLMDSDNFADETYFINIKKYIKPITKHYIISPSFAKPNFNYKIFENTIITKKNIREYKKHNFLTLMNTGNYLLTKNIIDEIKPDPEIAKKIHSADVIYFNTLCFQQFDDFQFHVIDIEYDHVVHPGSCYMINHIDPIMRRNADMVHQQFDEL